MQTYADSIQKLKYYVGNIATIETCSKIKANITTSICYLYGNLLETDVSLIQFTDHKNVAIDLLEYVRDYFYQDDYWKKRVINDLVTSITHQKTNTFKLCYFIRLLKDVSNLNDIWCNKYQGSYINFLWWLLPSLIFQKGIIRTPGSYRKIPEPIYKIIRKISWLVAFNSDNYNVDKIIIKNLLDCCSYLENSKLKTSDIFEILQFIALFLMKVRLMDLSVVKDDNINLNRLKYRIDFLLNSIDASIENHVTNMECTPVEYWYQSHKKYTGFIRIIRKYWNLH